MNNHGKKITPLDTAKLGQSDLRPSHHGRRIGAERRRLSAIAQHDEAAAVSIARQLPNHWNLDVTSTLSRSVDALTAVTLGAPFAK